MRNACNCSTSWPKSPGATATSARRKWTPCAKWPPAWDSPHAKPNPCSTWAATRWKKPTRCWKSRPKPPTRPEATDQEVRAAYRRLALKHHPDRVATLGEDVKKAAEEKFQEINNAKERIYKARGMK